MASGMSEVKEIPVVPGYPLVGVAWAFQKDPLGFIQKQAAQYPDLFCFKLGLTRIYCTHNAEYTQYILQTNHKNYDKRNLMYREMALLFGQGTPVVDGERWQEGHDIIQPSLSMKRMSTMMDVINGSLSSLVLDWEKFARAQKTVNATTGLFQTTLSIIIRSMFGSKISEGEEVVSRSFRTILEIIVDRITSPFHFPTLIPTPQNLKYQQAIRNIDSFLYKMIDEKMALNPVAAGPGEFQDMLSQWIVAMKEQGKDPMQMTRKIRDEIIGIFVAGHGSSATSLSWMLYHVATNPQVQERLHEEMGSVLAGRIPKMEDFSKLKYTKAVIEESLRITPPGWVISRSSINEDQLGPYKIPAGSMVLLSPYLVHHDKRYWDEPEKFDPERFLTDNSGAAQTKHKAGAYIPFTLGPRICTGRNLAIVEATLFLTTLVQKFKLELLPGHSITPYGGFTLNLRGDLLLNLTVR